MFSGEPQPTPMDLHWRMFGIDVRVHPFFWLFSALLGGHSARSGRPPQRHPPGHPLETAESSRRALDHATGFGFGRVTRRGVCEGAETARLGRDDRG